MANMTLPSCRAAGVDRYRVRPKRVKVWRCTQCGAVYDAEPKYGPYHSIGLSWAEFKDAGGTSTVVLGA